jgi:hypothetical protein
MKGTAVVSAQTAATSRIVATATGRTLTVKDTVNGAEIRMTVNSEGGLERELIGTEGHDKQYGNNIAVAVGYSVAHLANRKAGVAKNLQAMAKQINAIPAKNIRNLSNRFRKAINEKYELVSPYAPEYTTCEPSTRGFFHELCK